jgi:predicted dehydrogenase
MSRKNSTRRDFLKTSTAIGAAIYVGHDKAWSQEKSPNERVRYACIGVAGSKGRSDCADAANHGDVVVLCDVDEEFLGKQSKNPAFKDPELFKDYREMFEKAADKFDAVTITTPDHHHYAIASMAMKAGKAVFCQKPLTHSVWEARELQRLAKEHDLPTQMGNQGTSHDGLRRAAALLKSGYLGEIKEAHIFTNRPVWEQGGSRPAPKEPPAHLDWDLWIGPAPMRPYADGVYHPFAWRGWWDFGTGALGDMACHTFNMPFMGLGLANPTTIQATCSGHNKDSYPQSSQIEFLFPSNDWRGECKVVWYDGGNLPSTDLLLGSMDEFKKSGRTPSGAVIVGEKGSLYSWGDYGENWMLLPEGEHTNVPDVEFEKSPGHFTEFHQSITGERKRAMSNIDGYSGPLTETILLGNLAVWTAADGQGKKIEWDAEKLEATNAPEVADIIRRDYREGWSV